MRCLLAACKSLGTDHQQMRPWLAIASFSFQHTKGEEHTWNCLYVASCGYFFSRLGKQNPSNPFTINSSWRKNPAENVKVCQNQILSKTKGNQETVRLYDLRMKEKYPRLSSVLDKNKMGKQTPIPPEIKNEAARKSMLSIFASFSFFFGWGRGVGYKFSVYFVQDYRLSKTKVGCIRAAHESFWHKNIFLNCERKKA